MWKDSEKIKKLIEFKEKLKKKIEELESEIKEMRTMLEAVDAILLEKGFKRPELPKQISIEAEVEPSTEFESVIPLKSVEGELLANLHVEDDSLHVVMTEDKNFTVNTPPFTHFLIERVLKKMQEKDKKLAESGQLTPDKIFSYNIVTEGDIIREMQIKNVDKERLRELKSSIRWTLEKMYEKMKV
jgi:hypothetical protein